MIVAIPSRRPRGDRVEAGIYHVPPADGGRLGRSAGSRPKREKSLTQPRLTGSGRRLEVKLDKQLFDRREDRGPDHPQIGVLHRVDIEQEQLGQHGASFPDDVDVPPEHLVHLVGVATAVLSPDQIAEGPYRVRQIVEQDRERSPQLGSERLLSTPRGCLRLASDDLDQRPLGRQATAEAIDGRSQARMDLGYRQGSRV